MTVVAYDEELAGRVRSALEPEGPAEEQRMFGGLAFLLAGHMAVAVTGHGGLMVRVAAADLPALLDLDDVEPMVMGTRTSRTWVHVTAPALASDADLEAWVARGVGVVRTLGPKGR